MTESDSNGDTELTEAEIAEAKMAAAKDAIDAEVATGPLVEVQTEHGKGYIDAQGTISTTMAADTAAGRASRMPSAARSPSPAPMAPPRPSPR